MAPLFGRRYTLTLGDSQFSNTVNSKALASGGLRIEFKVKKTLKKEPNTLDLRVTNLARSTRNKYTSTLSVPVILSAGYAGSESLIFSGDSRTIDHIDNGHAEFFTHVQCGDGEKAYRFSNFKAAYGAGKKTADVIRDCAKTFGINLGNLEDVLSKTQFRGQLIEFARGATFHGRSASQFEKLLNSVGLKWSIQNGALQLHTEGKAATDKAVLLNTSTGLIGSPDHAAPEKKGGKAILKVKSLLQPSIRCGGIIKVEAEGIDGQFVVQSLEHAGDSHGAEWYTMCEATAQ